MKKLMVAVAAVAAMMGAVYAIDLPVRYVQTEYIESSGDQWIETGYPMSPDCRLEIDFQMINTKGQQYLFGSADNALVTTLYINGNAASGGKIAYSCNNDASKNTASGVVVSRNRRLVVLDAKGERFSITNLTNGGAIEVNTSLAGTHTKTATVPLFLFTTSTRVEDGFEPRTGRDDLTAQARLYSFKIYRDNELVRDFVPCRDTVDDVNGLYETVEGEFYGNAHAGAPDFKSPNDPYVEASGKMPVNTGYFVHSNSFIEVDFAFVDATRKQQRIIGVDSGAFGTSCAIYSNGGDPSMFAFGMGDTFAGTKTSVTLGTRRHLATLDFRSRKCSLTKGHFGDVETVTPDCTVTQVANWPLAVFGSFADRKATTDADNRGDVFAKVYRLTISEYDAAGKTLSMKHDFAPCVKGGVAGFRDLVTGVFVTDEFHQLGAGGAVIAVPDDPCLVSDGGAYIDTGYTPTCKTRVEMDFAPIETDTWPNNVPSFFGVRGPIGIHVRLDKNNEYANKYTYTLAGATDAVLSPDIVRSPARRTVVLDAARGYVEFAKSGYVNYSAESEPLQEATASGTMVLFARRDASGVVDNPGRFKCYGCKIFEDGVPVRDYAPCMKDGIAGFWDSVSSTFVTSVAASRYGFHAEGAVREEGDCDAYLESTGDQILSTGYFVRPNTRVEIDFALTDADLAQQRILGTDSLAGQNCSLYLQGTAGSATASRNVAFGVGDTFKAQTFRKAADAERHVAVYNFSARTASYTYNGQTITLPTDQEEPTVSKTAIAPLAVFGRCKVVDQETGTYEFTDENPAKVRVFSLKIQEKENNVWVPKHIYLPCKTNGRVGLFDTFTGEFHEDERTTGVPFRYGGAGTNGTGRAFAVQPTGGVVKPLRPLTLIAFAPGADSYQWYRDGVAIEGETGVSCTVEYAKGVKTATYQSKAIFTNAGEPKEVLSDAVEITNCGRGLIIVVE